MTTTPRSRVRHRTLLWGLAVAGAAITAPSIAAATSVAYIDAGEVWVSSLDGATKVRVSAGEGAWREVAAADNGVIAATYRANAGNFRAATFRTWSPTGAVTDDGGLTAPTGWLTYVYPVGFDISGDGRWLTYGYSQTNGLGLQQVFQSGHYVRNVSHGFIDPYRGPTGEEWPSFGPGNRLVTSQGGSAVHAQAAPDAPFTSTFGGWFTTGGTGLEVNRTDVSANGALAAFEADAWSGGTRTTARIGVVSVSGVGGPLTGATDCWLPATGLATDVSLSQDGTRIAWRDAEGIKVAGAPSGTAELCALASPPVRISATGTSPSIGGADAAAIRAARTQPAGGGAPLAVSAPALRALTLTTRGAAVRVTAVAAGRVTVVATVAAARLGRRGAPVVIARGTGTAARAGRLAVRLRPTAAASGAARRLKGARVTLTVTQVRRSARKVVVLR